MRCSVLAGGELLSDFPLHVLSSRTFSLLSVACRYQHNPEHDHYEFGYRRGNEHHFQERYEKAAPHAGHFKTKVRVLLHVSGCLPLGGSVCNVVCPHSCVATLDALRVNSSYVDSVHCFKCACVHECVYIYFSKRRVHTQRSETWLRFTWLFITVHVALLLRPNFCFKLPC